MPKPHRASLQAIGEALVHSAGGFLRNTIREAGVTCSVCAAPIEDRYEQCWACNRHMHAGLPVAGRVASMVYAIMPCHQLDQSYKAMRGYKAPSPVAAHWDLVASLLALGLTGHADCDRRLSGRSKYQWAIVPSTRTSPQEQPLRRLVAALTKAPDLEVPVSAIPGSQDYRELEPANFAVEASAVTDGGHVLLIDDSWVQGGHAQSVAAALRQAGAGSVSVLTVARVMRPDHDPNPTFIKERLLKAEYDPWRCPWTGGACP